MVSAVPGDLCCFFSRLNHCYSSSHYCAILVESGEKEESQKMDDLTILATCWFGTLGMLSSQVNGPVGNKSTQ